MYMYIILTGLPGKSSNGSDDSAPSLTSAISHLKIR